MVGVCSHRTALVNYQAHDDESFSSVPCTICDKRAFDITGFPPVVFEVRLKCPHCNKIIHIPFTLLLQQN